jgi:hypothetical protein
MENFSPGDTVTYINESLRVHYGTFKVVACNCTSCRQGRTILVSLPSDFDDDDDNKHVGPDKITKNI